MMLNSKCCKKGIKIIIALVSIAAITKISYEMKWIDLALGIFKLETGKNKVERVSLKTLAYIAHVDSEIPFLTLMEDKGWRFIKHYGRGMIFDNEGYEMLVTKNTFFNKYTFYEVTTREIFEAV